LWQSEDTIQQVSIPNGAVLRSFPSGKRASLLLGALAIFGEDDQPTVYDLRTGEVLTLYSGPETVRAFNSGGNAFFFDGPVAGSRFWRVGDHQFDLGIGEALSVSPNARFVYIKKGERDVLLDLEMGTRREFPAIKGDGVSFSPDSSAVILHSFNDEIFVRDAHTGDLRVKAWGVQGVPAKGLSLDGRRLITGTDDGELILYLLDGWGAPVRVEMPGQETVSVAFSTDSVLVAVAGKSDWVRLFETGTRRELARFGPMPEGAREAAFSPDDALLAVAGRDGRVEIWDLATGQRTAQQRFEGQRACSVEWLNRTTLVALGCRGEVWRWVMGSAPKTIHQLEGKAWRLRKTPVGTVVVTRKLGPSNLVVLDPGTGMQIADNSGGRAGGAYEEARYGLAISPDGAFAAASSGTGTVYVHDATSMSQVAQFGSPWGPGLGVAFHPTLPLFVASTAHGELVFWDTATWERLSMIKTHSEAVRDLAISGNGRWLASVSEDEMVLFDLEGALPWQSTGALGRALQPGEVASGERTLAVGWSAAKYGASKLALLLVGDALNPVEKARFLTLSGDPDAASSWSRAAEAGEVSPAALALILASLQSINPGE
jgi:WD40 repeat protein